LKVLLEAGADLSIRDQDNETPILKARRAGHRNLVILLEEHFIRINKLPSLVEKPTDKAATLPLHMKTNSTSDEDRETTGRTVVNDSNVVMAVIVTMAALTSKMGLLEEIQI